MRRRLSDAIRGAAEVMFPVNDIGAPDWRETEMESRTLAYFDDLPPATGRLLVLLFVALELVLPLTALTLPRFSRRSPATRERVLRRWKESPLHTLRLLFSAVKAALAMVYLSHPAVVRHIEEFKTCDRPNDRLVMAFRPEALPETAP